MLIKQYFNSFFKKFYSSEEIVDIKQIIDNFINGGPFLCNFPTFNSKSK